MRQIWPNNCRYELSGEIDKAGHPLIREGNLGKAKPDFLVHLPGNNDNFAIIEVKPINANTKGIKKDLKTLTAFIKEANYQRAIYLFYGNGDIEKIIGKIRKLYESNESDIDLSLIEFWHHDNIGNNANKFDLNI